MSYNPKAVANYFIRVAKNSDTAITPMQLQKLVYISHGWHLGLFSKPMIDDSFEAWKYGPVCSSLYQQFKSYGSGPIRHLAPMEPWKELSSSDRQTLVILEFVWKHYGQMHGVKLSNLTHAKGTPWAVTQDLKPSRRHAKISNDLIEDHYRGLAIKLGIQIDSESDSGDHENCSTN